LFPPLSRKIIVAILVAIARDDEENRPGGFAGALKATSKEAPISRYRIAIFSAQSVP